MFLKLNFTSDKFLNNVFRTVNQIINTPAITSVATLQSTAISQNWNAELLTGFDPNTSEIVRTGTGITGLTSNTVSRYMKAGTSTTHADEHAWTLEFSRYDNTSLKYYVQHFNGTANNQTSTVRLASGLSSGSLSDNTSSSITQSSTSTVNNGTNPTFNASLYTAPNVVGSGTTGFTNIRSLHMYVSDTALVWSATCGTTFNVGFGNTYTNSANYIGPFIYSQYNRFDYHNTNTNGIIPLLFTNTSRGTGVGFGGVANDWTSPENVLWNTTGNNNAFRVFNLINGYPSTSASFPIISQPYVNWGIGQRYTDWAGLTTAQAGSASTTTTPAWGPVIFTTVGTRYPSANLRSQAYGMLPVSWRNSYYHNSGGDASARGGWYVFNGDYYPGDEFTFGEKTYEILPTWTGYTQRVGIAIPKE